MDSRDFCRVNPGTGEVRDFSHAQRKSEGKGPSAHPLMLLYSILLENMSHVVTENRSISVALRTRVKGRLEVGTSVHNTVYMVVQSFPLFFFFHSFLFSTLIFKGQRYKVPAATYGVSSTDKSSDASVSRIRRGREMAHPNFSSIWASTRLGDPAW